MTDKDRTPWLAAAAAALICSWGPSPALAVGVPSNFVVESATPGRTFTNPTALAFLPDGRYLVAEKRGRVYLVDNGVVAPTPVLSIENEVLDEHDRGMLGLAIDPGFASNRLIYVLYTVDPDTDGNDLDYVEAYGRLTRYHLDANNVAEPASRTILIGATWTSGVPIGGDSHTIGCLRFGQDGSLLVTTGDGALYTQMDAGGNYPKLFQSGRTDPFEDIGAFRAQSLSSLAGKVLRINPVDGSGYPSNPYWDGNAFSKRSRIWCYGLRNPFRFTVRPGTGSSDPAVGDPGSIYVGDVGWTTWEEANVAVSGGRNFGWPCYEGRYSNSDYQSASPAHNGCGSFGTSDNPTQPTLPTMSWHHSDPSLGSPSGFNGNCSIGGVFYTGAQYPSAYRGRYFFGDYGQNWMQVATFDANDQYVSYQAFATNVEGPVDFAADPITGDVFYVSILAGEVRRLRYTGPTGNSAPIAVASGNPEVGLAPLAVQFSSAGTFDPDGDPVSYSWAFGDGQGSTSQNPSHTYSAPGLYYCVLTASDTKGGVGRDTVVIGATAPGGFPTTSVLDGFNRPDGPLGGSWSGDPQGLVITGNQLAQTGGYANVIWNGASFGPTQEAYFTLNAMTGGATEHDLMLKAQSTAFDADHIEVRYDVDPKTVSVSTYAASQGWVTRGGPYSIPLQPGDRLGARAYPNGAVEVYRNSTLMATAAVTAWPFYASGGRVGMTLTQCIQSRFDNFGGGNAVLNPNTPPDASIQTPGPVSFYVTGDVISLSGSATDAQDPSSSLSLRWEVDILHNTHIHPLVFTFTGPTASFVGENHDDGTGAHYRVRLIATDTGGLSDTATVSIYPESDLSPGAIQVSPSTLTDVTPAQVSFTLRNLGRMLAPISRWQLRMDGTTLAFGDTIVQPLSTVSISRAVGVLPGGPHTLRVTADSLAQVVETNEANNVSLLAISVTDGTPPTFILGPTATPGSTSATIAWTTSEAATGAVRYGVTPALGDSITATSATSQSKALTGLARGTLYYFQVAATDASGNTRLSSSSTFTTLANRPPVASASGNPTAGAAPLAVQFSSAGSSDPDGDPIGTSWDFGDGGSSTAANPSHTYSNPGTYTATLTVTDGLGGSASASVTISAGPPFPTAAVLDDFNRPDGALGGAWTGQTSGLGIQTGRLVQTTSGYNTVIWNGATFGADQEVYVTLTALTAGAPEHDVLLKMQGTTATSAHVEVRYDDGTKRLHVGSYTPTGGWVNHASFDQTFVAGDVLGARAYGNGTVDVFRNGAKIASASIVSWPYYAQGGRLGLTLALVTSSALDNFGGGSVAASGPDVTPPSFTSGPTASPGVSSAQVTWSTNETARGAVRFGLTSSLGDSVTTSFATSGSVTLSGLTRGAAYFYRVAVTDAAGNTTVSALSSFVVPANRAPVAAASGNPSSGPAPLAVQFSSAGSSDPDGDPLTYAWTFGDGGVSAAANPSHTYAAVGPYTASLTVSDGFGGSAGTNVAISVGQPDLTPPQFLSGPGATPSMTSAAVQWTTNEPARGAVRYGLTTSLGDSVLTPLGTSASATISGLTKSTTYFYRVAITDAAGNTTLSALASFTTLAKRRPFATASGTPTSGQSPLSVRFSSDGSNDPDGGTLTYAWTFGDGQVSTDPDPDYLYTRLGTYTADLTVTDSLGQTATASVSVMVLPKKGPCAAVTSQIHGDGVLSGGSWGPLSRPVGALRVTVDPPAAGSIWEGEVFDPDQEAYVTLAAKPAGDESYAVLLKVQDAETGGARIEARFDPGSGRGTVSTYDPGQGWRTQGSASGIALAAGDVIGARALATGDVELVRNGEVVGTVSVKSWPHFERGGRVGIAVGSGAVGKLAAYQGGNRCSTGGVTSTDPGDPAPSDPAATAGASNGAGGMPARSAIETTGAGTEVALSGAYPNPARGGASWVLSLPEPADVEWQVLDLQGRSLWRERVTLPAGASRLSWRAGRSVAPGVYVAAVRAAGRTLTRRFVMLP